MIEEDKLRNLIGELLCGLAVGYLLCCDISRPLFLASSFCCMLFCVFVTNVARELLSHRL
jgi:hypothetical protein